MSDELKGFGEIIKNARISAGFSLREIEEMAGIGKSYFNDIENGRKIPSIRMLQDIANVLALDIRELLEKSGRGRFCGEVERPVMSLGGVIREARRKLGLSLRDVAPRLGISDTYLYHIENGRRAAPDDILKGISKVLGINLALLKRNSWKINADSKAYLQRRPKVKDLLNRMAELDLSDQEILRLGRVVENIAADHPKKLPSIRNLKVSRSRSTNGVVSNGQS